MKGEVPFGRWLQRRRKELDLTQDELALQIGCATSTLQKMEAGRRRPSPEFAGRLAEILDVDLDKRQAFIRFARGSANPAVFDLFRPPTNLPAQSTPLIGREEDVAAVRQRLLNDDTRLVTLVGPPGIGKTRLSLEVAAEARDHFQDGVYFVPLAPVTDVSLIAPAIIRALNLRLNGRVPPLDYLCGYLRFKRMLLLLDNFEQVMAATDQVVQLLAACPPLKLLITSRMPLHLRAERQYPVPPLAIPDLDRLPPVDELARYGAVALFADRAEALKPGFAITPGNAPAVAAICCRLDGLPLAIELVSARIKILSPAELLNRLDAPLVLHSNGMRDADPRQHTLAQAISSSYDLLSPEEQALFARLAVHVGGWTLEAAEFGQSYLDSPAFSATLDELASLVDKSLVIQISEDGRTRFTMLETIRQYALDQLRLSGQVEVAHRAHAVYYLSLIEKLCPKLHQSVDLVNQIEEEHDNFQAALRWSLESREVELAYRLGLALASFWTVHTQHLSEGRRWLNQIRAAAEESDLPTLAQAWLHQEAGLLAYLQGDFEAARALHQRALALGRVVPDLIVIANALHGLSNAAMNQGRYQEVADLLADCLPLARASGERMVEAMALNNLAEVARLQGNLPEAERMYREGLDLLSELDDKLLMPILLDGLGTLAQYQGDYENARAVHKRCLALCREMGDRRIAALALEKLAGVAAGQGQGRRASRLLGAAEALRETIRVPVEEIDRADYERIVTMTRAILDEDSQKKCWLEGRALSYERAIAYALGERPPPRNGELW